MKNDCVFCAIAAGEIPCRKIWEDADFLAYLDINPCSPGHALVVPKEHYPDLAGIPDGVLREFVSRVKKVAALAVAATGCDGYNIVQNNGEAAGQTVRHIHFHVIPRRAGEVLSFKGSPASPDDLDKAAAAYADAARRDCNP